MAVELQEGMTPQPARPVDWLDVLPEACGVLWDEQRSQVFEIARAIHDGYGRILVQGATGSGKTHVIGTCVLCAADAGMRVLILATRTRLVRQIHERLDDFGVTHGVIAAPLPSLVNFNARVQIASADTLYARCIRSQRTTLPGADLVIFDEAHLALGDSRLAILERYPNAWRLGFTATPAKVSGRPLRDGFDKLIIGPPMRRLIELERLVRCRVFNKPVVSSDDLREIERDNKTNDYGNAQLGETMRKPKLIGHVVENWLRIANGKRTIVFACNKAHAGDLQNEFLRVGVPTEILTDKDDEPTREEAIARLERGETKVIVNAFLLSYGVDIPSIECIVLARPTRSLTLYLQMVGRGMRAAPGKDSVIVIDHGRVVETLGLPTEDFGWTLENRNVSTAAREAHVGEAVLGQEKARQCPECSHLWLSSEEGNSCKECGWKPPQKMRPVEAITAELHEHKEKPAVDVYSEVAKTFFREAIAHYRKLWPDRFRENANKARGFAWQKTRERFQLKQNDPPDFYWHMSPADFVSKPTDGWLTSKRIQYVKSKAKEHRQREFEQSALSRTLDRQFAQRMERER